MLKLSLNNAELQLVSLFDAIGYGDIWDVEIPQGNEETTTDVSDRTAKFILELRRNGPARRVQVHDSEPAFMEVDKNIDGYDCTLKFKF